MEYPLWTSNTVYLLGFYFQARKFCVHFSGDCIWAAMGKYDSLWIITNGESGVMCTFNTLQGSVRGAEQKSLLTFICFWHEWNSAKRPNQHCVCTHFKIWTYLLIQTHIKNIIHLFHDEHVFHFFNFWYKINFDILVQNVRVLQLLRKKKVRIYYKNSTRKPYSVSALCYLLFQHTVILLQFLVIFRIFIFYFYNICFHLHF